MSTATSIRPASRTRSYANARQRTAVRATRAAHAAAHGATLTVAAAPPPPVRLPTDPASRAQLAETTSSPTLIDRFAADHDPAVRAALARNPQLPAARLAWLTIDPNAGVAATATATLTARTAN